jgi:hypothetical protein
MSAKPAKIDRRQRWAQTDANSVKAVLFLLDDAGGFPRDERHVRGVLGLHPACVVSCKLRLMAGCVV